MTWRFVAQSLLGLSKFAMELEQMLTGKVLEFHALEVVPDSFIRVQFRGIGGQSLQLEPFGRTSGQELFDHVTPVDRRPIPQHQYLATKVAVQVAEEPNDIGALVGTFLYHHVQFAIGGDTADSRQVIVGPPLP